MTMTKEDFREMIKEVNEDEKLEEIVRYVVPEGIIDIMVDGFEVWKDFDGMSYEDIVKMSDETGFLPVIDDSICVYGDMKTPKESLSALIAELFDMSEDFDISLAAAATQHRFVYVECDEFFVLLY